jgi:hypothetical protein
MMTNRSTNARSIARVAVYSLPILAVAINVTPSATGIVGAVLVVFALGFEVGKVDMRGEYHECIELGAPQQNCIDNILGKRE